MRRLHPATILVAFGPAIRNAAGQLLPILFISLMSGKRDKGDTVELALALVAILGALGSIATYISSRFGIEEGSFQYKTGLIFRKDRKIPLEQIQNVNIRRTALMRLLRVAAIQIETAAGTGAEISLSVLSERDAEALRRELSVSLASADRVETAPDYDQPLPTREILLTALGENHVFAVIAPILGSPFLLTSPKLIGAVTQGAPRWALWLMGLSILILLFIAGWAVGVVAFVLRSGGFRLSRNPESLRVEYGLINKTTILLRRKRIELVTISRNLLQRRMGRATVRAATAGTFGEAGADAPLALSVPWTEVDAWTGDVAPRDPVESLSFRRFHVRVLIGNLVTAVLVSAWPIATGLLMIQAAQNLERTSQMMHRMGWMFVVVGGMLFVGSTLNALLSFPRSGIAVGRDVVAVRSGWFRETIAMIPLDRIEVFSWRQPRWWRRFGLWSGQITAMSRSISFSGASRDTLDELEARMTALARNPEPLPPPLLPPGDERASVMAA